MAGRCANTVPAPALDSVSIFPLWVFLDLTLAGVQMLALHKILILRGLSGRQSNGDRVPLSVRSFVTLLMDCPSAGLWSVPRIAIALRYSERSIIRAIQWLRQRNLLSVTLRRRSTSCRALNVQALLGAVKQGFLAAKAIAAAGRRLLERTWMSSNIHCLLKEKASWEVQSPPSDNLRLLAARLAAGKRL